MSRLDYVTIAIVAVCVAALVYLIYMTTNLLGSGSEDNLSANEAPVEQESTYDEEEYYPEDTVATLDDGYYNDTEANDEEEDQPEYDAPSYEDATEDLTASSETTPERTTSSKTDYASVASGQYMVLAGTFKYTRNAQEMVTKLKGMGYNNASVELFDRGAFAVALVDRFDDLEKAQGLKTTLSGKGIEAYVKQKK